MGCMIVNESRPRPSEPATAADSTEVGHPDRRVRVLDGLGVTMRFGEREALALVLEVLVTPHAGDDLDRLLPVRPALPAVDVEGGLLHGVGAAGALT